MFTCEVPDTFRGNKKSRSAMGVRRLGLRGWNYDLGKHHLGVSINMGTPKWMVYKGKSHSNGWFGGTPISGNLHLMHTATFTALKSFSLPSPRVIWMAFQWNSTHFPRRVFRPRLQALFAGAALWWLAAAKHWCQLGFRADLWAWMEGGGETHITRDSLLRW